MDDACVVMTARKSRFVLNKRCAKAHWSSVSAPQSVVKIAAGAAVVVWMRPLSIRFVCEA
jgi:hypothetical protein